MGEPRGGGALHRALRGEHLRERVLARQGPAPLQGPRNDPRASPHPAPVRSRPSWSSRRARAERAVKMNIPSAVSSTAMTIANARVIRSRIDIRFTRRGPPSVDTRLRAPSGSIRRRRACRSCDGPGARTSQRCWSGSGTWSSQACSSSWKRVRTSPGRRMKTSSTANSFAESPISCRPPRPAAFAGSIRRSPTCSSGDRRPFPRRASERGAAPAVPWGGTASPGSRPLPRRGHDRGPPLCVYLARSSC